MSKASFGGMHVGRPTDRAKTKLLEALKDVPAKEETRRVNFEVTEARRLKLKIAAARQGMSIKDFLTAYIDSLPDPL